MAESKQATVEELLRKDLVKATGYRWIRQRRVTKYRLWRIDLSCPKLKISVEVEGGQHLNAKQQRSDSEKANLLVAAGWRVLRYPASSVLTNKRRERIVSQVSRIVCGVRDEEQDSCCLNGE